MDTVSFKEGSPNNFVQIFVVQNTVGNARPGNPILLLIKVEYNRFMVKQITLKCLRDFYFTNFVYKVI